MTREIVKRCENSVRILTKLAEQYSVVGNQVQYGRVMAKIEGVKLALSYVRECDSATVDAGKIEK